MHNLYINLADAIPELLHFPMKDHIFNRDVSFVIIEQMRKSTLTKKTKKKLLKHTEKFWIIKLETLKPKGLREKLNK